MLIRKKAHRSAARGHGLPAGGFAELRSQLATGSSLSDAHRQRLLELAQRLTRVQALQNEYAGITFSPMVSVEVERLAAASHPRPATRAGKPCLSKRSLCMRTTNVSGVPTLVAGR